MICNLKFSVSVLTDQCSCELRWVTWSFEEERASVWWLLSWTLEILDHNNQANVCWLLYFFLPVGQQEHLQIKGVCFSYSCCLKHGHKYLLSMFDISEDCYWQSKTCCFYSKTFCCSLQTWEFSARINFWNEASAHGNKSAHRWREKITQCFQGGKSSCSREVSFHADKVNEAGLCTGRRYGWCVEYYPFVFLFDSHWTL